jgi:hypothetical protein
MFRINQVGGRAGLYRFCNGSLVPSDGEGAVAQYIGLGEVEKMGK